MADALLDTTFFIDLRRGEAGAIDLWRGIQDGTLTAAYSSVTAYELWLSRTINDDDKRFFSALFELLEEAPLTSTAAIRAASWLRDLPRGTRDRRLRDAFITATAQQRGETVYTRNVADLRRFTRHVSTY